MKLPENEEQGQGLVEYALLIALIAVIVIAILTLLGPQITLRLYRDDVALESWQTRVAFDHDTFTWNLDLTHIGSDQRCEL